MSIHQFNKQQILPISLDTAWGFFSSPKNLVHITPPEMKFKVLTKLTDKNIHDGMLIEYAFKPFPGIRMKWKTRIDHVSHKFKFTDEQISGPYKMWEHTHTFTEITNGVLMIDTIYYQLPLGILGDIIHAMFIREKIKSIFCYRESTLTKLFMPNENRT